MKNWDRWGVVGRSVLIIGLMMQSTPMAWAQLSEVDPALHAAVEALVSADPEVAGDPELAQLCRTVAEATVTDIRERVAVAQEVAVMQREGVDIATVIPREVRESAREQFTKMQGERQKELETLRAVDPERAKEVELMMREGEKCMLAFESGERYAPSTEMVTHAREMFNNWEASMMAEGAPREFVDRARMEMARFSSGEGMMFSGGPGHEFGGPGPGMYSRGGDPMAGVARAGYDTGAAKELATKLGVDANLNLNDPAVVERLVREGKLTTDALSKALGELGAEGHMDVRLGEMTRTFYGATEPMGGRGYTQIDGSTATLVEAMTKSGAVSEARARELMVAGGNVFDPNSKEWQALSPEEKASAASMSQRAAEALAYEQAGGDKSGWFSGYEHHWEGGSNYGINPATGGWEPGMGGGTTYTGGTTDWSAGGGAHVGYTDWSAGGGTWPVGDTGVAPAGGSYGSWEGGSNYGINPATGGWEPNMGGGTTYTGGTTDWSAGTGGGGYVVDTSNTTTAAQDRQAEIVAHTRMSTHTLDADGHAEEHWDSNGDNIPDHTHPIGTASH